MKPSNCSEVMQASATESDTRHGAIRAPRVDPMLTRMVACVASACAIVACGGGVSPDAQGGTPVAVAQTGKATTPDAAMPDAPVPGTAPAPTDSPSPATPAAPAAPGNAAPAAGDAAAASVTVSRDALLKAMNPGFLQGHVHAYVADKGHTWDIFAASDETSLTHLLVQTYNPLSSRPLMTRTTLRWSRTDSGAIQFADTAEVVVDGGAQVVPMKLSTANRTGLLDAESFEVPTGGNEVSAKGLRLGVLYSSGPLSFDLNYTYEVELILGSGDDTPGSFRLCVSHINRGHVARDANARISCTLHDAQGNAVGTEGQYVSFVNQPYYQVTRTLVLKEVQG